MMQVSVLKQPIFKYKNVLYKKDSIYWLNID